MALTETWLNDEYLPSEVDIPGYSLFRSDRNRKKSKRGRLSGGVCIYIRDDCAGHFEPVIQFSNGVVELLVVYNKALKLCIVVAYRQPDQFDGFRSTTVQFKEAIDKIHAFLASLDTSLPNVIL